MSRKALNISRYFIYRNMDEMPVNKQELKDQYQNILEHKFRIDLDKRLEQQEMQDVQDEANLRDNPEA